MSTVGPIGRLGRYTATHFKQVAIGWGILVLVLAVFAPRVESALSGAGWEASGSESVQARQLIDKNVGGLSSSALQVVVHSETQTATDPAFQAAIAKTEATLKDTEFVGRVVPPQPGMSISKDGHTAIVQGAAAGTSNDMVRA
ncbi:MAG: MMPL family transporter, partial [Actinomycetales bacterium]